MRILGIETSCDETAAAIWEDDVGLRSNVVASQAEHSVFGGVVPELASRAHIRKIIPVIHRSLSEAGISIEEVNGIAVTYGPGLIGSLIVGLSVAKALSLALDVPLIGIHHIEAHIFSSLLQDPEVPLPLMTLVASGGHTELVLVEEWGNYRVLGRTRDDAAGEAFDKVAKMLGLGYPGGPEIDRLAQRGDPKAIHFPRPLPEGWNFSFSGLKTAVLYYLESHPEALPDHLPDVAAGFQRAVVDVLFERLTTAALAYRVSAVAVVGGVAANRELRQRLATWAKSTGVLVVFPSPALCTDNAAMVARAGSFYLNRGKRSDLSLAAMPRSSLPERRP